MSYVLKILQRPISNNDRMGPFAEYRAKKKYGQEAGWLAIAQKLPRPFRVPVNITVTGVYPKRHQQADRDNMGRMMKWIIDGIKDAGCLVDDKPQHVARALPNTAIDPDAKRGYVIVEIEEVC